MNKQHEKYIVAIKPKLCKKNMTKQKKKRRRKMRV